MTVSTRLVSGLLFATLLASQHVRADAETKLNKDVKLNHATVFLRGAELDNTVTLSLNKGTNSVILTNIASNIDPRTLSIDLEQDDVVIRSVNIQNIATEANYPMAIAELLDQKKQLSQQIETLNIAIKVGEEQLNLLKDHRFFGENTAKTLEESAQKLNFIRQQMSNILQEQQKNQLELVELQEKATLLQAKIDEKMPSSIGEQTQIVLSIDAQKPVTAELQISYLTPDAAWSPSYDIRSLNSQSPIVLTYKADIVQNTGIDWDKVNLTLSTINPSKNITPSVLQPWRLSVYDNNAQIARQARMKMPAAPIAMYEESSVSEKKTINSGVSDFVTTSNNGVNLNYQIALPYSLKSTIKPNSLTIKQQDIDVKYKYTATPKLTEEVFLQANIEDWQSLNLLNGNANVYYGNTYVGNFIVNANQLVDTLSVPFGVDKSIQVSRESNEKMKKKPSFMGSTIQQTESYLVKVKNMHTKPIELTVYDQIPVSEDSDIKVSAIEDKNAVTNKSTGEITWDIALEPNEEKQISFSYSLSYPKDKQILGL
ncbi:mucoidy inhibitor MuiA family protein [Providencia huaxiensis]|uniref:mucoidy inhibitor MuiA family protein n=1 Tax=Providencia huaxiensis TaxID=2027290 RepID=UPI0032D9FDAC